MKRAGVILSCAVAYCVLLAMQMLLMPPEGYGYRALMLYLVMPIMTFAFGPFLFVSHKAWVGSGEAWWILKIVPLFVVHMLIVWLLFRLSPTRLGSIRKTVSLSGMAMMSVVGVWFALPVVGHYEVEINDGRLSGGKIRIAVVSDLHSCDYGPNQCGLVEMIASQSPDLVVMTGDIFDDRLPDENGRRMVEQIVKLYPCVYVSGNH